MKIEQFNEKLTPRQDFLLNRKSVLLLHVYSRTYIILETQRKVQIINEKFYLIHHVVQIFLHEAIVYFWHSFLGKKRFNSKEEVKTEIYYNIRIRNFFQNNVLIQIIRLSQIYTKRCSLPKYVTDLLNEIKPWTQDFKNYLLIYIF